MKIAQVMIYDQDGNTVVDGETNSLIFTGEALGNVCVGDSDQFSRHLAEVMMITSQFDPDTVPRALFHLFKLMRADIGDDGSLSQETMSEVVKLTKAITLLYYEHPERKAEGVKFTPLADPGDLDGTN